MSIKGAKVGDEVLIDAKLLRKGRNLAFLEVELRNKINNDLLVKGNHTKFVGWIKKENMIQGVIMQ